MLEARVFDGSDTGKKVYSTLAIIGLERKGRAPDSEVAAKLAGVRRWPVTISYFNENQQGLRARIHDFVRSLRERRLGHAEARLRRLRADREAEEAGLAAGFRLLAVGAPQSTAASLRAQNAARPGGVFEGDKPAQQFVEEARQARPGKRRNCRRDCSRGANPGPANESGCSRQEPPRPFVVKAEGALDGGRDFKRGNVFVWRPVSDRQHHDMRVVADLLWREHDGAGPVLCAFLLSAQVFGAPEVGVANNEARLRPGQAHGFQSFMRSSRWLCRGSIFTLRMASTVWSGSSPTPNACGRDA